MPSRTVRLTDHLDRFVEDGISSGRYSDESEMVRIALELLEKQEDALKLQRLREAVQLGIEAYERGEYIELRHDEIEAYIARLGKEAEARVRRRVDQE